MARKKQLKISGRSIVSFTVQVKNIKSNHADTYIDVIDLEIRTNEDEYKYDIRVDERAPDIHETRDYIEASLNKAKEDCLRIEISEYTERNYLFFKVQSIGQTQYTGYRV